VSEVAPLDLVETGCSKIKSEECALGRLFRGPPEPPEASSRQQILACSFLRASLRARRMAAAFSRTLRSEGFS
jgi:hypothetical protein